MAETAIIHSLSCPFCGDDLTDTVETYSGDWQITCMGCGACGPPSHWAKGKEDAVVKWNQRAAK